MKITEGRRLAAILGIYIGVFSLYVLSPQMRPFAFGIGLLITLAFGASLLLKKRRVIFSPEKAFLVFLAAASLTVACVRGADFVAKTETRAQKYLDSQYHRVTGRVTEVGYERNYGSSYDILLTSADGEETALGITLTLPYNGEFSVGDTVVFEAVFSELDREYGIYRKADGIFLSAESESAEKLADGEASEIGIIGKIRLAIKTNFEMLLDEDSAGFATALMTGDKTNLNGRLRLNFTRIGISHILAVSGLHLSIVIGGLDFLLRRIAVPRKFKNVILIVGTFFFALLCGLSASIVRAAVMHMLFYVADTVGERNDSPTSLFVAIFLIVFIDPSAVWDVGMWMSFLATFGILATAPSVFALTLRKGPRLLRKILNFCISLVCMTVAAVFFTLPIAWLAFGGVSLLSPLANLIFIPLTQLILYLLIALSLFGRIPFLSAPLGQLTQTLISAVFELAEYFSDMKGIYVSLRYPFVPFMMAVLILGLPAVLFIKRVGAVHMFTVFAVCSVIYAAGFFGYAQMQGESAYVYLQTDGKSDAVGIVSRNETIIVDISTGGYSVLAEAVKHTEDFYACEIDALVLTHYHSYHINTLHRLTERVMVRLLLLPEPLSAQDEEYYRAICDRFSGLMDIEIYKTDGTQSMEVGNASLSLPRTEYMKRSSHPIVCFSVGIGEKGFSYFGEGATETALSDTENSVQVFGSHGPSVKHIFDFAPFADAEIVIFADEAYADLTDTENFSGQIVFPEDYGGWIKILFE